MIVFLAFLVYLCDQASAVIYRLNDSDYYKMPSIFHLDDYEECVHQPDWVYCSVEMLLVSDEPSPLLQQIQEYSEHKSKHFNYTKLQYGVCIRSTCNKYINEQNNSDPRPAIESCYNDTMWQKHKLKVRIIDDVKCNNSNDTIDVETSDVIVAAVFGIIVALNVMGSIYEVINNKKNNDQANGFWLSFSMLNNSKNLFNIEKNNTKTRRMNTNGLNGLRCLTTIIVVLGHSPLGFLTNIDNPRFIEQLYDNELSYLFFNGTIFIQTFFILGSFLHANNLLQATEQKTSWAFIPKTILFRYIRLTVPYAVVLAFEATLLKFMRNGPLWANAVDAEVKDCHQNWWSHMVYLNNYITKSQCLPQSWYLAADMQLYIVGLLVFVLITKSFIKNVVLFLLFFGGILMTALHTFFQDLNSYQLITPENSRTLFMEDATYHCVYRTGHTNVVCYVMGLALSTLVYNLKKTKFNIRNYKKFTFIYWSTMPGVIGLLLLGSIYYMDVPRTSLASRVVFAAAIKPLFGLMIIILIFGLVFKFENIYRGVLEWTVWVPLARLSYSVFLVHIIVIRTLVATHTTLMHGSTYGILSYSIGTIAVSHIAAFPLWLLVEAPVSNLMRIYFKNLNKKQAQRQRIEDSSRTFDVKS